MIIEYADDDGELSPEQKRDKLYYDQVNTLKTLLEHNAITKRQYDKSYTDLTKKMGY